MLQYTQTHAPDDLLTVRDVADRLRISEPTVWRAIASGDLRAYRIGRAVRIAAIDADSLLQPYRDTEIRG